MTPADARYPIGPYERPPLIDAALRASLLRQIAAAPLELRKAVADLADSQLDTPYREGGWTIRQVAHHLPDSHLNAYVRFKLALTEDEPAVKTYEEARWAELPDARTAPIDLSLGLLEGLHGRWIACLQALAPEAFARAFRHPQLGLMSIDQLVALYAWHGRHHVAQIWTLRKRKGWDS